jgi:hypothetical protein
LRPLDQVVIMTASGWHCGMALRPRALCRHQAELSSAAHVALKALLCPVPEQTDRIKGCLLQAGAIGPAT